MRSSAQTSFLYVFGRISVIEHVLKDRSRLRLIEDLNPLQLEILKRTELPMPKTYVRLEKENESVSYEIRSSRFLAALQLINPKTEQIFSFRTRVIESKAKFVRED